MVKFVFFFKIWVKYSQPEIFTDQVDLTQDFNGPDIYGNGLRRYEQLRCDPNPRSDPTPMPFARSRPVGMS